MATCGLYGSLVPENDLSYTTDMEIMNAKLVNFEHGPFVIKSCVDEDNEMLDSPDSVAPGDEEDDDQGDCIPDMNASFTCPTNVQVSIENLLCPCLCE